VEQPEVQVVLEHRAELAEMGHDSHELVEPHSCSLGSHYRLE
jgi:hypothetical protein